MRKYSPHERLRVLHQHLVLDALRLYKYTTSTRLSERLNINPRTIYRLIDDLRDLGYSIDAEAGVGYVLRQPRSKLSGVDKALERFDHEFIMNKLMTRGKTCAKTRKALKLATLSNGQTPTDQTESRA